MEVEGSVAVLGKEIAAAKQAVGDLEAEAADVEDKAKAVNLNSREQVRTCVRACVDACSTGAWPRGPSSSPPNRLPPLPPKRRPGCCMR